MKVFEGLPATYRTAFFVSLGYTAVVGYWGYSVKADQNAKEKQEFIDFYRSSGHYKHPWVENPAPVAEHVRKTDYTKVIETPQGMRYFKFGYRV